MHKLEPTSHTIACLAVKLHATDIDDIVVYSEGKSQTKDLQSENRINSPHLEVFHLQSVKESGRSGDALKIIAIQLIQKYGDANCYVPCALE